MASNTTSKRSGQEPIGSVKEFVARILDMQAARDTATSPFWFRGQGDDVPELKPSSLREWFVDRAERYSKGENRGTEPSTMELAINREFRRRGTSLLPRDAPLVDVYFLAQHHGLPTRLLDWTTNPLAALFFAVTSNVDCEGAVVVTVADGRLSIARPEDKIPAVLEGAPFDMRAGIVTETIASLFGEAEPPSPGWVLPVLPDLRAGRMLQQGSCFTLHMPGAPPIPQHAVTHLRVQRDRKPAIERELNSLGVSWATLFPDLDHLSRELRDGWQLWPDPAHRPA